MTDDDADDDVEDVVARAKSAHAAYVAALDERTRRLARSDPRLVPGSRLRDVQELLRRVDHLRVTINRTEVDGLRPRWDVFDEYLDKEAVKDWRSRLAAIDEAVEVKARNLTRVLEDQEFLQRLDGRDGKGGRSTAEQMGLAAQLHQRITESAFGQLYVRSNVESTLADRVDGVSRPTIHPQRVAEILEDSPLSMPGALGLPEVASNRELEVFAMVPPRPDGGALLPALELHTAYVAEIFPLLAYAQLAGFGNRDEFAPMVEQALAPLYPTSVFEGAGTLQTILGRVEKFDSGDRGDMFGGMGDILGALRGLCTFFDAVDRVARDPTREDVWALIVAAIGSAQDARSVVTSLRLISYDAGKRLARGGAWLAVPLLAVDTVTNLLSVREALGEDDYGLAAGTLLVAGGSVTVALGSLATAYGWGVFAGPVGVGIVTAGVLTVFAGAAVITLTERGEVQQFSRYCMFGTNRQLRTERDDSPLTGDDIPAPGAHDFEFHDHLGRHDPVRQLQALASLAQPLGLQVTSGEYVTTWTLARHNGSALPLGPGHQRQVLVMTDPPVVHSTMKTRDIRALFTTGEASASLAHAGEVIQLRVEVPRAGLEPLVLYAYAEE